MYYKVIHTHDKQKGNYLKLNKPTNIIQKIQSVSTNVLYNSRIMNNHH